MTYFDGKTYVAKRDKDRLTAQLGRVSEVLGDHDWHSLYQVAQRTGDPEQSVSARIRDLRKVRFGGHTVERRYVARGVFQYRLAR